MKPGRNVLVRLLAVYTIITPPLYSILGRVYSRFVYITTLIGLPLTILFPLFTGYPILYLYTRRRRVEISTYDRYILSWSIGFLIINSIEIFYYTIPWLIVKADFNTLIFSLIVYGLSTIGAVLSLRDRNIETSVINDKYLAMTVVLSLLMAGIISFVWPFPYANENDYIRHAFYSYVLSNGRPLLFYYPYIPAVHTMISLPLMLSGSANSVWSFLYVYWVYRFVLYPFFAFSIYTLAKRLIGDSQYAMVVGLLSISIVYVYESSILPWHTAPKNIMTILYVIAFSYIIELCRKYSMNLRDLTQLVICVAILAFVLIETRSTGIIGYDIGIIYPLVTFVPLVFFVAKRSNAFMFLPIFYALLSTHKLEGILACAFLMLYLVLVSIRSFYRIIDPIMIIVVLATASYILSLTVGIIPYPEKPYFMPPSAVPMLHQINDKIAFIANGLYIKEEIILFVAGLLLLLISRKNISMYLKIVLIISLLSFLLAFMPVNLSYRLLKFGYPFTIITITYAIFNINKSKRFAIILLIGLVISLAIHDYYALYNPKIIKLQEKFAVFEYCNSLKRHFHNATFKDTIVFGYSYGLGWYQAISSYCAGFFTINLWHNGTFQEDLLREVYINLSSKDAYNTIRRMILNPSYVVSYPDKNGYEFIRWYRKPRNIIILYDDILARWLGNPYSVYKFMDPRFYSTTDIIKSKSNDNSFFYVFKLRYAIYNRTIIHILCSGDCITKARFTKYCNSCNVSNTILECKETNNDAIFVIGPLHIINGTYLVKVNAYGTGKVYMTVVLKYTNNSIRTSCGHFILLKHYGVEENCIIQTRESVNLYLQFIVPRRTSYVKFGIKYIHILGVKNNSWECSSD